MASTRDLTETPVELGDADGLENLESVDLRPRAQVAGVDDLPLEVGDRGDVRLRLGDDLEGASERLRAEEERAAGER